MVCGYNYAKKAELFHRPSVLIMESSTPVFAVAVAAPIRKLWPVKFCCSRPMACRAWRTNSVNLDLYTMYESIPAMGHSLLSFPGICLHPFQIDQFLKTLAVLMG